MSVFWHEQAKKYANEIGLQPKLQLNFMGNRYGAKTTGGEPFYSFADCFLVVETNNAAATGPCMQYKTTHQPELRCMYYEV